MALHLVYNILYRYSEDDSGTMSPNGLHQFLKKEQQMKNASAELAIDLIRRFDPSPSKEMGRMTLAGNSISLELHRIIGNLVSNVGLTR